MFTKKKKQIYLDYAAATPVDPVVLHAMQPYFSASFYNPSALYTPATEVKQDISDARTTVADYLGSQQDTIVFTSGGTESDNMAIFGVTRKHKNIATLQHRNTKGHIITTSVEHSAVLEPIRMLEKEGFDVTYIPVDSDGLVNAKDVADALREDTVLVSVMYVNNEIGTIQPLADIGRIILKWRKEHNTAFPYFHTDACQATNYLDMNVERLHVDLLTANGSKIYGPKDVGILYVRRGVPLEPLVLGGGQEFGYRSGTENVPGIIGFATSVELIIKEKEHNLVKHLRDYFWTKLKKEIPGVSLNGPTVDSGIRLPNNLNVYIEGIDAEALVLYLDAKGIYCSVGSACSNIVKERSHVLEAIGKKKEFAGSCVRFTLGRDTTKKDIDFTVEQILALLDKVKK